MLATEKLWARNLTINMRLWSETEKKKAAVDKISDAENGQRRNLSRKNRHWAESKDGFASSCAAPQANVFAFQRSFWVS
jgi:hypothetical protein